MAQQFTPASGNFTAADQVSAVVLGKELDAAILPGTFVGKVIVEVQVNGAWVQDGAELAAAGKVLVAHASQKPTRLKCSEFTSGSIPYFLGQ